VTGDRRRLAPTVELNAYRIVQESLTNSMKHASGSPVTVRVDFGPEQLHLHVRDLGGEPSPARTPGNGLVGMRQRVDLLGGALHTGPAPGGGFVVDCVLPAPVQEVARDTAGADR
jgi:signal transduction histidine kinase